MLTLGWCYIRSFLLIYVSLFFGNLIAGVLPIDIPGSILGMIVLFMLLSLNLVPAEWVKPGCLLIIRYMALLFIPVGVGIMKYYDLLSQHLGPVLISCFVSTVVTMLVVGFSAHFTYRKTP